MTADDLVDEIPALYRFARALVRDDQLAADLTQDTLVRAIERFDQYRNDAPLGAWLKRILRIDRGVDEAATEAGLSEEQCSWVWRWALLESI